MFAIMIVYMYAAFCCQGPTTHVSQAVLLRMAWGGHGEATRNTKVILTYKLGDGRK